MSTDSPRIADLLLTEFASGVRVLVNAFDIATVQERRDYSLLTLKVPVATSKGSVPEVETVIGYQLRVAEPIDSIIDMRAAIARSASTSSARRNETDDQRSLAQRAFKVGERLRDGTVVLSVDLERNEALFLPAAIFGGKARFDHQGNVVKSVNEDGLCGHKDWRLVTDAEGATLARAWNKVAPAELQASGAPWFWLASSRGEYHGRMRRGGEMCWTEAGVHDSHPVPVVRSGSALSLS